MRGEFRFATVNEIAGVANWPARGAAVERMLLVDRGSNAWDSTSSWSQDTSRLTASPWS